MLENLSDRLQSIFGGLRSKGRLTEEDINEIGDLILGNCKGRTSDEDVTIYDPAGMALLDIAAAKVALDLADEKNLGTVVEL